MTYKDTADSLRMLADWAADELYEESMYVRSTCEMGADVIEALLRKLASYEDMGLSPEEIKLNMDGLDEYHKAEAEGRLVVSPCKVGDVIWWKNVYRIVDCHVVEIQISAERSEVIFRFGPQLNLKAGARFEDFGKTVFLTREEAEAAMNGGQDE